MMGFAIVAIGAALGGAARHGVNLAALRFLGPDGGPAGTLAVNVVGSTLMGVVAGWFALRGVAAGGAPLRLFLATGILGGFTTFSAFSLDAVLLAERGTMGLAAGYVAASVVVSIGGLVAGLALVRLLLAGG